MDPLKDGDPEKIGGYRLLGRIGSGGMGQVYLGESPAGQHVAVKMIKASVLDEDTRARFILEVDSLKTVYGTSVAAFVDADAYADQPWLAVEYVPGPDLRTFITEHGPLPLAETASLGALLAEGLRTVHGAGLLHRDLKPQNIVLSAYGPKVIDFGLAVLAERRSTLTATGFVVGSVLCMPPEQARGEPGLTPAADVYALGAVLLYAATGHYPYTGPTWQAIALQIEDPDTAPNLDGLPPELCPVIEAMLAHDTAARPTLDEVTRQLVQIIEGCGLTAGQAKRRLTQRVPPQEDLPTLPPPDHAPYSPAFADPVDRSDSEENAFPADDHAGGNSHRADTPSAGRRPEPEPLPAGDINDQPAAALEHDVSEPAAPVGSVLTRTPAPPLAVPLRIAEKIRASYARKARL